jgi:hypothetical protein
LAPSPDDDGVDDIRPPVAVYKFGTDSGTDQEICENDAVFSSTVVSADFEPDLAGTSEAGLPGSNPNHRIRDVQEMAAAGADARHLDAVDAGLGKGL